MPIYTNKYHEPPTSTKNHHKVLWTSKKYQQPTHYTNNYKQTKKNH